MTVEAEELRKPDMVAVLSRTHLSHTLHSFMLPVLEAISNAIDGIEQRFQEDAKKEGKVLVRFVPDVETGDLLVSVSDNGIGLNENNYRSFQTPFSGFKLAKKGRGFGRFIAFKVFNRILYSTRYELNADLQSRTFRFDIKEPKEIIMFDGEPDFTDCGTTVELNQPLEEWKPIVSTLDSNEVLDEIGSHFLPYFLFRWLPQIKLQYADNPIEDISQHFASVFVQQEEGQFECQIEGRTEQLNYSLARIPKTRLHKNHCLLFSAAARIVGAPRDLTQKIGSPHFQNSEGEKYIVIAVVHGEAFESRLNDSRTSIDLSSKVVEEIVDQVSRKIQTLEFTQIEKIRDEQSLLIFTEN